jgi:hypothetical protein
MPACIHKCPPCIVRSEQEIKAAEKDLFDRLWYQRSKILKARGIHPIGLEACTAYEDFAIRFKDEPLDILTLQGRLAALRWTLGAPDWRSDT